MTRIELLESRGIIGDEARTALANWERNPHSMDALRVGRIFEMLGDPEAE